MEALQEYLARLRSIERQMGALRRDAKATLKYHALADAVYWSDEIPPALAADQEDALRILLRYRTSLILGAPEQEWRDFWETGQRHFPHWPGFSAERTSPDPTTIGFYRRCARRVSEQVRGQSDE